jgi:hypothetical protein
MSIFLDPRGKSTFGIGICARCQRKMSLDDLMSDPNYPGLRVCEMDMDEFDPYRLAARQPERITLNFPRPDVPVTTDPGGLVTESDDYFIIVEEGGEYLVP